jgi:uncharacterized circularly permuted ATP-grasp superfamily protein
MHADWTSALQEEQAAQDTFLSLLHRDPQQAYQDFKKIRQHLVGERILFGDKPVPLIFPPFVLSGKRWNRLANSLDELNRILTELEPKLVNKRWLDWLGFEPDEQEWIQIAHQVQPGKTISRVDGFLSEDPERAGEYKIVELNIDSPGGGAFLDVSAEIIQESDLWKEFQTLAPGAVITFRDALYDHLESVWEGFLKDNSHLSSPSGKPRIAIVDWVTVSTHREFELIAQGLSERGYEAVVADPRELSFSLGRLRCYDGKPIDLVYRRVLVEDMLRDPAGSRAIIEAVRERAVCLVNNFSSKPLTVKSLLALFHDPQAEELLNSEELAKIRELVPLTLKLTAQNQQQILRDQEQLVLKPADGWGAQGLYLGWRCTKSEWAGHVKRSLAIGGYVAQEKVPIPSRSLPTWTGKDWECFPYLFDLSPYGLAENSVSPLVRLSPSEVLNVKRGAQIAAVWVLDEPQQKPTLSP